MIINPFRFAGGPNFACDLWETFELSSVTAAQLEANDSNDATWVVNDGSGLLSVNASAERATISTVNSTADTGTLGLKKVYSSTVLAGLECRFAADHDNASLGFWFRFTAAIGNNRILIRGQNNTGSDALDAIVLRSATSYLGWGTTGNSNGSALSSGTWYWVTIQYNRNATSYLRVYDTSSTLVGSEATATAPNVTLRRLYPFDYNANISDSADSYMDDLCVDYTDATFPLGP